MVIDAFITLHRSLGSVAVDYHVADVGNMFAATGFIDRRCLVASFPEIPWASSRFRPNGGVACLVY
jgi:hypothetical protein